MNDDTGILLVAFGRQQYDAAHETAASVRAVMPRMAIAIATDLADAQPDRLFDTVIQIKVEAYDLSEAGQIACNRIDALAASPFRQTLFIDSDMMCAADLGDCFTLLTKKALVATPLHARTESANAANPLPGISPSVIGFNRDRLPADFFTLWRQLCQNQCPQDAATGYSESTTLRQLLWDHDINMIMLDHSYHCRIGRPALFTGPIRLVHRRGAHIEDVVRFLNITEEPRLYLPHTALMIYDAPRHDWTLYPFEAPDEPSRFHGHALAYALLAIAEENGIDRMAARGVYEAMAHKDA